MINLKMFDGNYHDGVQVARFLYEADPEFAIIGYKSEKAAIEFFTSMIQKKRKPFIAPYLQVIELDNKVVGAILGFPVAKFMSNSLSYGSGMISYFGLKRFFKMINGFTCLGRACSGHMKLNGYYLMYLCVDQSFRGQGIGTKIIDELLSINKVIYLHVNLHKPKTVKFYQKNGFVTKKENKVSYKGQVVQARLLEKRSTNVKKSIE